MSRNKEQSIQKEDGAIETTYEWLEFEIEQLRATPAPIDRARSDDGRRTTVLVRVC